MAWVVTLAGMAELILHAGGEAGDEHGTDQGGAQRGARSVTGVLQAAHLGAFAVGDGETVTAPTGMVTIAAPAPGARRRPRR